MGFFFDLMDYINIQVVGCNQTPEKTYDSELVYSTARETYNAWIKTVSEWFLATRLYTPLSSSGTTNTPYYNYYNNFQDARYDFEYYRTIFFNAIADSAYKITSGTQSYTFDRKIITAPYGNSITSAITYTIDYDIVGSELTEQMIEDYENAAKTMMCELKKLYKILTNGGFEAVVNDPNPYYNMQRLEQDFYITGTNYDGTDLTISQDNGDFTETIPPLP